MKIMFISDIHGSYKYLKKALDIFELEQAKKLVILGDILYHGPRNDLPDGYEPKKVIKLLNDIRNKIIAVRGNCDAEVDQMVLEFPIRADYATIDIDNLHFFLTHGHLFDENNLPNLNKGDVFVYGHIHKQVVKEKEGIYIINPSSISLPKEGKNSYGIYENNIFYIKELNGDIVDSIEIE